MKMKKSYRKTALLGLVAAGLLVGSYGAALCRNLCGSTDTQIKLSFEGALFTKPFMCLIIDGLSP